MKKRIWISAGLLAITAAAQADLQIDGFGTGVWDMTMSGFDTFATHTVTGLNTQDTLFGMRTTSVNVLENFFNLPLAIQSGRGAFKVTSQGLKTDFSIRSRYDSNGVGVNMSHEQSIKVDVSVSPNASSTVWIGVIDTANTQRYANGSVNSAGYVIIRKNQFGSLNWASVKTFIVESSANTTNNHSFAFENIALVPEPTSLLGLGVLALLGGARSRRRR